MIEEFFWSTEIISAELLPKVIVVFSSETREDKGLKNPRSSTSILIDIVVKAKIFKVSYINEIE